jgi:hypothetical protein
MNINIGELFWQRNALLVSKVSANIHTAIEKLVDSPLIIPNCLIRREPIDNEKADSIKGPDLKGLGPEKIHGSKKHPDKKGSVLKPVDNNNNNNNNNNYDDSDNNDNDDDSDNKYDSHIYMNEGETAEIKYEKYWGDLDICIDGRKTARKDLRTFLRLLRHYYEAPTGGTYMYICICIYIYASVMITCMHV